MRNADGIDANNIQTNERWIPIRHSIETHSHRINNGRLNKECLYF